ncbi:gluconate transporter [Marispirochaeta aestuarii]|uniref:Gluconate transporter n=1 Tax=Marispirochaeta aestuarii TaxID=1963862 RepID=A0A1Y1RXI6_9SPIO|nr:GntP family permease [Marispirochaeta aestuarii]ORC34951.1 gluconate transporter [Marispirochaeta aestuarii]
MVSGGVAIIFLLVAVVLIVLATSKWNMNPFFVLISVAFLFGLAVRLPLLDIVNTIKGGFGGTLGSIGIVILCGTIIGFIMEKTGAALSITQAILKVVGNNRAPLAMSIAGYIVSVPVFCDSGFVILTPLNKALSAKTGTSMGVMAVALATGLHATHALVPPTPGPIAAAGNLGADLGKVIFLGAIVSIFSMLAGYIWALKIGSKYDIKADVEEDYDSLIKKYGHLPTAFHSSLPLLIPIILILLKSLAAFPTKPFGDGGFATFISFIGDPVTALVIGVIVSLTLVKKSVEKTAVSEWMSEGLKNAALIIAITGAGGAFGAVLKASPMANFIGETMSGWKLGILLPFIISVSLKTAQGSGTVALITTSAILAPLLGTFGLDPALTVLAIGSGAMVVSHANDSYFWVVSQFSGIETPIAYKIYTTATGVQGITAFIIVFILSLFI